MYVRTLLRTLGLSALALVMTGCPPPHRARGGGGGVEATKQIVIMDRDLYWPLKIVTNKAERETDGRLRVIVVMKNDLKRPLALQVQTVFKDASGTSTRDETNWEPIVIPGGATDTYRVSSGNAKADDFVVRIRRPTHAGI